MNKRQRKKVLKKQHLDVIKDNLAIVIGNKLDGDSYPYHYFPIGTKVLTMNYGGKVKECVPYKKYGVIDGSTSQLIKERDLKFI